MAEESSTDKNAIVCPGFLPFLVTYSRKEFIWITKLTEPVFPFSISLDVELTTALCTASVLHNVKNLSF